MKNLLTPLAKGVLVTSGSTAAASAADGGIHKKILRPGTLSVIISNKEMRDIMKIVKFVVDSGIDKRGYSNNRK